jgi:hypothetical protein
VSVFFYASKGTLMANRVYTSGLELLANDALDWGSGDIRAILIDNAGSYTFSAAHETVDELGANELSGTGYSRVSLAGKSVNTDAANDRVDFLANAITYTDLDAGEPQAIVIYMHVSGDDTENILISYHDGGFPRMSNGEDFTVNFAGESNNRVMRLLSPVVE